MPVRIIFRGLILFRFPQAPDPDAGKLVAELINNPNIARRGKQETSSRPPHGPHEHNHDAQIQIATDHGKGDKRVPVTLKPPAFRGQQIRTPGERIDITVLGVDGKPISPTNVEPHESFKRYVPRLVDVIRAGTPEVRQMEGRRRARDPRLIRNTIVLNHGQIRVRQLVTWDEGGFPLDPSRDPRGSRPALTGFVKFVGSDFDGFVASEFVVDIDNATAVNVKSTRNSRLTAKHNGRGQLNHRVPYETVEILITNYEYQENTALPWGLDFQWLFQAAGFEAVDLVGANLDDFAARGARFNRGIYEHERRMLLDPVDDSDRLESFRLGRPFPYLISTVGIEAGKRAGVNSTDEDYRPICIGGQDE